MVKLAFRLYGEETTCDRLISQARGLRLALFVANWRNERKRCNEIVIAVDKAQLRQGPDKAIADVMAFAPSDCADVSYDLIW